MKLKYLRNLFAVASLALLSFAPTPNFAQNCTPWATSTSLAAIPDPVVQGQNVTMTATVTSANGTPSGTVKFTENGANLGSTQLRRGVATLTVSTATVATGTYQVVATYVGDSAYGTSNSSTTEVVTSPASTTTTTTVAASPNPATAGGVVTISSTVTATTGSPTGIVTFTLKGVVSGSYPVVVNLGKASVSVSVPTAGTFTYSASYAGATGFGASASGTLTETVNPVSSGGGNPPPTGTALSACADLTTTGSYYLTQNVTSTGTCFFIDADNITLNLAGFTITYGTGGGTKGTPGILLADNWYTGGGTFSLAKTGSTNKHGGFTVYGGSIIGATNSAPQSHAIWVGQSGDVSPAPIVHDTTLTTYSTDGEVIFGDADVSGWQIYNNVIAYNSVTTTSRYGFYGYAVWLGDNLNSAGAVPDKIYNNKILAAPQGGIFDDHQNATIGPNNDITFNSFYSNDYCVINYGTAGQVITTNNCHPTSGRGIDAESANVQVLNNTITTTELKQNAEYNGCEAGGSDGIRIRDNSPGTGGENTSPSAPVNVTLSGNTVISTGTVCEAVGLRMSYPTATDSITATNNTFTTIGPGNSTTPDYAISFEGANGTPLNFTGNTLSSTYSYVGVDWDGVNEEITTAQVYLGSPKFAIDNENGYTAGSGQSAPTFAQSVSVAGAGSPALNCGPYAAGPTTWGTETKTCN